MVAPVLAVVFVAVGEVAEVVVVVAFGFSDSVLHLNWHYFVNRTNLQHVEKTFLVDRSVNIV